LLFPPAPIGVSVRLKMRCGDVLLEERRWRGDWGFEVRM
jgi:hypothetical protein